MESVYFKFVMFVVTLINSVKFHKFKKWQVKRLEIKQDIGYGMMFLMVLSIIGNFSFQILLYLQKLFYLPNLVIVNVNLLIYSYWFLSIPLFVLHCHYNSKIIFFRMVVYLIFFLSNSTQY